MEWEQETPKEPTERKALPEEVWATINKIYVELAKTLPKECLMALFIDYKGDCGTWTNMSYLQLLAHAVGDNNAPKNDIEGLE